MRISSYKLVKFARHSFAITLGLYTWSRGLDNNPINMLELMASWNDAQRPS